MLIIRHALARPQNSERIYGRKKVECLAESHKKENDDQQETGPHNAKTSDRVIIDRIQKILLLFVGCVFVMFHFSSALWCENKRLVPYLGLAPF